MTGIYKITSPSGKVYIGQSRNIDYRKNAYRRLSCPKQIKLYCSLSKYGWEAHNFEIVHELPKDIDQKILDNYELFYWQSYKDCQQEMMNLTIPGPSRIISEETKRKISDALTGKKLSEEHRKKLSQSHIGIRNNLGRKFSDDHKRKIGESKLGNKYNIGRKMSEHNKQKLFEAKKGKALSEEHKEKIRKALIGNKNAKRNG